MCGKLSYKGRFYTSRKSYLLNGNKIALRDLKKQGR